MIDAVNGWGVSAAAHWHLIEEEMSRLPGKFSRRCRVHRCRSSNRRDWDRHRRSLQSLRRMRLKAPRIQRQRGSRVMREFGSTDFWRTSMGWSNATRVPPEHDLQIQMPIAFLPRGGPRTPVPGTRVPDHFGQSVTSGDPIAEGARTALLFSARGADPHPRSVGPLALFRHVDAVDQQVAPVQGAPPDAHCRWSVGTRSPRMNEVGAGAPLAPCYTSSQRSTGGIDCAFPLRAEQLDPQREARKTYVT